MQNENAVINVVTLTYNQSRYIRQCIESVLAQRTSFPFTYIIADDGSDDGTAEIVREYAQKYPDRIVPVFEEHVSSRHTVRKMFEACRGKYVTLCEGDDYYTDPGRLHYMAEFLEARQECAACFHPVRVKVEGQPDQESLYPDLGRFTHLRGRDLFSLEDLLRANMVQTNGVMYRWRFRDGLPDWFRENVVPGDWYWHLLHAELGPFAWLNRPMSVYRRHAAGMWWNADYDKAIHLERNARRELDFYREINAHFKGRYLEEIKAHVFNLLIQVIRHCAQSNDRLLLRRICCNYYQWYMLLLAEVAKEQNTRLLDLLNVITPPPYRERCRALRKNFSEHLPCASIPAC